jgi:riboflavin biosynthesis pyrimidine reductase
VSASGGGVLASTAPLEPLATLYDAAQGDALPLPPALARLYGSLRLLGRSDRPLVLGNFVSSLDGVVALNDPSTHGGAEISGFNQPDRMIMGILRAVAGAVIVGAGTLRADADHTWTAEAIYPPLADAYAELRSALGLTKPPLNVFVTESGRIDLSLRVFQRGTVEALIITSKAGADRLLAETRPQTVGVVAVDHTGPVTARFILDTVSRLRPSPVVLTEGGPHLMGDFVAERLLDELFLTLAPQIAGRHLIERPGFVAGVSLAPDDTRWGTLATVHQSASHLYLRYSFAAAAS